MHRTVVVVSNPDPTSLSHHVTAEITAALTAAGVPNEVADLAQEGFDPRFTLADRQLFHGEAPTPPDVAAQQERLDRADHLVLVFPMYWWSVPALLKGWIDRVFVNGWAFDERPDGTLLGKLDRKTIHLVPIAAGDADLLRRHGYDTAFSTQIEHGVLDYCGARRGKTTFLYESESKSTETLAAEVREIASDLVAATSATAAV
ncbi:NAD(P)H-dependent oxidoreductase [Nocardia callitridis]|uniref:NAD(P)H-dependent oxidoreductase n=1 Tax=Nocardia callitridis TaxID=648753 RepID=A0ABP9KPQ5_9NOCA